jgi:hypothetical protein
VAFSTSCIHDPAKTTGRDPGHDDYQYVVTVDHAALDGQRGHASRGRRLPAQRHASVPARSVSRQFDQGQGMRQAEGRRHVRRSDHDGRLGAGIAPESVRIHGGDSGPDRPSHVRFPAAGRRTGVYSVAGGDRFHDGPAALTRHGAAALTILTLSWDWATARLPPPLPGRPGGVLRGSLARVVARDPAGKSGEAVAYTITVTTRDRAPRLGYAHGEPFPPALARVTGWGTGWTCEDVTEGRLRCARPTSKPAPLRTSS